MVKKFQSTKIVCDPLWGLIDITEILPMVDTPPFQALGFKYQLGVTSLLFPSATHTRKQHCFGSFKRTQDLAHHWIRKGFISENEARLVAAYALWHDIGHGPFSHVIEEVAKEFYCATGDENSALCREDPHDRNAIAVVDALRGAVEATGVDFSEFRKFFTRENPLYRAVHDKNLGAEKLDYLARDAYYTLGEVPGVEYLAHYTYFINRKLVIDEKAIDQAKNIQEFYVKMYKNVYLRKNSIIAQRLMQKMVAEMLRETPLAEDAFWALTDFGLLGRLETSPNPDVRAYYRRFMRRQLPKTAISLRSEKFATIDRGEGKMLASFGVSEKEMEHIASSPAFSTPTNLEKAEAEIERIAKLPPRSVVVAPPSSVARFTPQDIAIWLPGGRIANLSDYFANHFAALKEEGESYIVMRICTFEEHRDALSQPGLAEAVKRYILSLVGE